jgi:CheY-like chemotaxis protein
VNQQRQLVLVVDDEERVRQVICEHLEDAGMTFVQAESGDAAWQLIQDNADIDLLLTDVRMPGTMNGFELVEAALAHRPTLKTIVMSGYTGEALNRTMPADLFLQKPFTLDHMLANMERLLLSRQAVSC